MYLNDDYEGGEIEFRLFDGLYHEMKTEDSNFIDLKNNKTIEGFNYKPKAGDIVIFPSDIPYYHGIKKIVKGNKLLIRTH
jgi:molybdopterin converting factor small subunit